MYSEHLIVLFDLLQSVTRELQFLHGNYYVNFTNEAYKNDLKITSPFFQGTENIICSRMDFPFFNEFLVI